MSIDGKYHIAIDSPLGKLKVNLELTAKGNVLEGTGDSNFGKNTFTGKVNGNEVSWDTTTHGPMGKMKLSFKGAIKGSDFSGEVDTGFLGKYPFTGKKI